MTNPQTKSIKVLRVNLYAVGTRMWYVVQGADKQMYQRWSSLMDNTDEVLFLTRDGDTLKITYVTEDHSTGDPYVKGITTKNKLISAEFV